MKALAVTQIEIPNGFRILAPDNDIKFLEKTGLVAINGNSGAGKSSLLEIMKLATQGKSSLRDDAFIREGEKECEIIVKIADASEQEGLAFYLCAHAKPTGEVDYKFKVNVDGQLKNATEPIPGLGKISPSKFMAMISTTLTYGADKFMSESEKTVTEFIFQTFPEVSEVAKPIEEKILLAVSERDKITEIQSAIGAYNNKLEGMIQPLKVDVEEIFSRRSVLIQDLADAKAEDKSAESNKEERIRTCRSELENIKLKAETAKANISLWNDASKREAETELASDLKRVEAQRFALSNVELAAEIFGVEKTPDYISFVDHLKVLLGLNVDYASRELSYDLIDIDQNIAPNNEEAQGLMKVLTGLRAEYKVKAEQINSIADETVETKESKAPAVQAKLDAIDEEIVKANETNALWEKFDVLARHTEANQKVIDLRAERNKLYESIDTGVKGLTIQLTDEDGKKLGFFYTGVKDPTYFANPEGQPRHLTSYSQTQKTYVAMMLALALMHKKQFPLNVIFIDNTGMDKRIYKMFNDYAKANGLLIFMTQTNDKTEKDLNAGEILISDGSVFVKTNFDEDGANI